MEGVLQRVKQERGEDIAVEASAAYDKQSKGKVEQAAQEVQGQVRTVRYGLEVPVGLKIRTTGFLFSWMVKRASLLLNIYRRGEDGRTAWER